MCNGDKTPGRLVEWLYSQLLLTIAAERQQLPNDDGYESTRFETTEPGIRCPEDEPGFDPTVTRHNRGLSFD